MNLELLVAQPLSKRTVANRIRLLILLLLLLLHKQHNDHARRLFFVSRCFSASVLLAATTPRESPVFCLAASCLAVVKRGRLTVFSEYWFTA